MILCLGVLLALSSVVSSALMAPDRDSIALETMAMVYGESDDAFCGADAGHGHHHDRHHDHHCPLCHGLPEAPALAAEGPLSALEPHDAWQRRDDLHRAAQARNLCHSPRAPPAVA